MWINILLFLISSIAVLAFFIIINKKNVLRDKSFLVIIIFTILLSGCIIFISVIYNVTTVNPMHFFYAFYPINVYYALHLYFLGFVKTILPIIRVVIFFIAVIEKENLKKRGIDIPFFLVLLSLLILVWIVGILIVYFFISAAVCIYPIFGLHFFKQFANIKCFNAEYFLLGCQLEVERNWELDKRALVGNRSTHVTLGHIGWNYRNPYRIEDLDLLYTFIDKYPNVVPNAFNQAYRLNSIGLSKTAIKICVTPDLISWIKWLD